MHMGQLNNPPYSGGDMFQNWALPSYHKRRKDYTTKTSMFDVWVPLQSSLQNIVPPVSSSSSTLQWMPPSNPADNVVVPPVSSSSSTQTPTPSVNPAGNVVVPPVSSSSSTQTPTPSVNPADNVVVPPVSSSSSTLQWMPPSNPAGNGVVPPVSSSSSTQTPRPSVDPAGNVVVPPVLSGSSIPNRMPPFLPYRVVPPVSSSSSTQTPTSNLTGHMSALDRYLQQSESTVSKISDAVDGIGKWKALDFERSTRVIKDSAKREYDHIVSANDTTLAQQAKDTWKKMQSNLAAIESAISALRASESVGAFVSAVSSGSSTQTPIPSVNPADNVVVPPVLSGSSTQTPIPSVNPADNVVVPPVLSGSSTQTPIPAGGPAVYMSELDAYVTQSKRIAVGIVDEFFGDKNKIIIDMLVREALELLNNAGSAFESIIGANGNIRQAQDNFGTIQDNIDIALQTVTGAGQAQDFDDRQTMGESSTSGAGANRTNLKDCGIESTNLVEKSLDALRKGDISIADSLAKDAKEVREKAILARRDISPTSLDSNSIAEMDTIFHGVMHNIGIVESNVATLRANYNASTSGANVSSGPSNLGKRRRSRSKSPSGDANDLSVRDGKKRAQ